MPHVWSGRYEGLVNQRHSSGSFDVRFKDGEEKSFLHPSAVRCRPDAAPLWAPGTSPAQAAALTAALTAAIAAADAAAATAKALKCAPLPEPKISEAEAAAEREAWRPLPRHCREDLLVGMQLWAPPIEAQPFWAKVRARARLRESGVIPAASRQRVEARCTVP